jgi:hypothetical protein
VRKKNLYGWRHSSGSCTLLTYDVQKIMDKLVIKEKRFISKDLMMAKSEIDEWLLWKRCIYEQHLMGSVSG